jgi:hypothetical protein
MPEMIPISEAQAKFKELIQCASSRVDMMANDLTVTPGWELVTAVDYAAESLSTDNQLFLAPARELLEEMRNRQEGL